MRPKIECRLCGKSLRRICRLHLRTHGISYRDYRQQFPETPTYAADLLEIYRHEYLSEKERKKKFGSPGKKHPMYGRKRPDASERMRTNNPLWDPKAKAKLRAKLKEVMKGEGNPFYGKTFSEEWRRRHSKLMKEWHKRHENPMKGIPRPDFKARYGDREGFERKRFRAMGFKPTKPERELDRLLHQNGFDYIYVGDGKRIIGGLNPDFIHRRDKRIIELFGNYWHEKQDEDRRISRFRNRGYDALIVWESELRDVNSPVERVREFEMG